MQVEHSGAVKLFDFGTEQPPSESVLQWAAFYADCVHEVQPVTAGTRITITFNLFAEPPEDYPLQVMLVLQQGICSSTTILD
jgi:hypothetical protein